MNIEDRLEIFDQSISEKKIWQNHLGIGMYFNYPYNFYCFRMPNLLFQGVTSVIQEPLHIPLY